MSGRFDNFDLGAFKADRRDFEAWRDSRRNEDDSEMPSFDVGEVLGPLLLYLADGYATGVVAKRAVALLIVVAPHLLADATYSEIAVRLGCGPKNIGVQVRKLREAIPALKGGFRCGQTSTTRLLSLNQLRHASRKRRYDDIVAARAKHREEVDKAVVLRQKLVEAKKEANSRALEAMREFDRITGLCPEILRRTEGQPSAPLVDRPDGAAAVGFVPSIGAKSLPRRAGRWF